MQEDNYPIPDNNSKRFEDRVRTPQQEQKLLHELEQFRKTDLFEQQTEDLQAELEETILVLLEEEKITDEQLHSLRGEARALYRVWKRQDDTLKFLMQQINNK